MPRSTGSVQRLPEVTTPTVTPPPGFRLLYLKADGQLYTKNSAGFESAVDGSVNRTDIDDSQTLTWMGF